MGGFRLISPVLREKKEVDNHFMLFIFIINYYNVLVIKKEANVSFTKKGTIYNNICTPPCILKL